MIFVMGAEQGSNHLVEFPTEEVELEFRSDGKSISWLPEGCDFMPRRLVKEIDSLKVDPKLKLALLIYELRMESLTPKVISWVLGCTLDSVNENLDLVEGEHMDKFLQLEGLLTEKGIWGVQAKRPNPKLIVRVIEGFRNEGYKNKEIASFLGWSVSAVGRYVTMLVREGRISRRKRTAGELRELEDEVEDLIKNWGVTSIYEISSRLDVSVPTAWNCIWRLEKKGSLPRRIRTQEEVCEFDDRVLSFVEDGHNLAAKEIALVLDVPEKKVRQSLDRLLQQGRRGRRIRRK